MISTGLTEQKPGTVYGIGRERQSILPAEPSKTAIQRNMRLRLSMRDGKLLFFLSILFVEFANGAGKCTQYYHNTVGSPDFTKPLHRSASLSSSDNQSSLTLPRARWFREPERRPRAVFALGAIAVVLAATFLVLRCFRMLKGNSGFATITRNLKGDLEMGGADCTVSCL